MAKVMIDGVPDDLVEELRASAKAHGRTLDGEVLARLEKSRRGDSFDVEAFLMDIERLNQRTNLPRLSDEMLKRAITEGRA